MSLPPFGHHVANNDLLALTLLKSLRHAFYQNIGKNRRVQVPWAYDDDISFANRRICFFKNVCRWIEKYFVDFQIAIVLRNIDIRFSYDFGSVLENCVNM